MRITKAETAAIGVTLALVVASGSFYLGRSTAEPVIRVSSMEEPSEAVSLVPDAPVESPETLAEISVTEPESVLEEPQEPELVDLNSASQEELETLPEIGPVLAQRIIEYRETHGGFLSVEELKNIDGIGDKIFASVENLVEVGK